MTSSAVQASGDATPLLSKTCQNCYHLKIRCDRNGQAGQTCDRCRRLGKHCTYRPARRRYNSARRDDRIEALESKIEELLRARRSSSPNPNPNPQAAAETGDSGAILRNESYSPPSRASTSSIRLSGCPIDAGLLTAERAEQLLDIYKQSLTPHFPFVIVPGHVTALQLGQEKPFLFLAVLSSASFHDMPLQRQLGTMVKQYISDDVVMGDNASFEVLQGLLVFLAWSQYHPRPSRYSQYLSLAISLISDLRLDAKPVSHFKTQVGALLDPCLRPTPQEWGSDEQRAVAGCFYLSSTISKMLQKFNPFPYTSYVEECCVSLYEGGFEYPTDHYLYYIVRLQHMMESIETLPISNGNADAAKAAVLSTRSQLESFSSHLNFDISDSHLLLMQYYTAELFLCQTALFDKTVQLEPPLQLTLLYSGLSAAKSLFDFYLSLPVYAEMAFNNSEWIQMSFAISIGARLTVSSATNRAFEQQTRALRHSFDLSNVIQHLCLRIGSLVTQQVDSQGARDIFFHYEQRLRRIQSWFRRFNTPTQARKTSPVLSSSPLAQAPLATATSMTAFSHDATVMLKHALSLPSTSMAAPAITELGFFGPLDANQVTPQLPPDAGCEWPDSTDQLSLDMLTSGYYPELDYMFCDWLSPMNNAAQMAL